MSRIEKTFARLNSAGRKALIPFMTAGDPAAELTVPLMQALVEAGADIIELGVPFSDPMADGPTIQRASERALARGMSLTKVLQLVSAFRAVDDKTPVVLMGYANPIEAMGLETFADKAAQSGVDGVLVVDYPPEEAAAFGAAMKRRDIAPIFLIAPTSSPERIAQVAAIAKGYVYYVSLAGVTGSAALNVDAVAERLPAIRAKTGLPVGVGFGIRDAATAGRIARFADAVVVGSRFMEEIEKSTAATVCANVKALALELRRGMDQVKG
ncbi:MAG: tryptophan synthase subunit alpha [Azonexus sp.]|jgi:tryptophan synthase alpha chain|nr:tryptophan synthase subunit alpha [Azonexus sp.]